VYIGHLADAFLFAESKRYDVRGKAYIDSPSKYYCEGIGLRNARIGFRQQEMTHMMENILYNELILRRFSVDVGVVYARELNRNNNSVRVPKEIDFVKTVAGKKAYIQSLYAMESDEKRASEVKPFTLTGDSFPKIIVRKDIGKRWYDDEWVLNIGLMDFLLDETVV
jgi:predicted AAA+ superfamily ATPase